MKRIFIGAMALCLMGFSSCGKDDNKPTYKKPIVQKEQNKQEEQKPSKEEESNFDEDLFYNTETDGDKIFTFPADYKTEKEGVKYGEVKYLDYESKTVGKRRPVVVMLPRNYSEKKEYPVVYCCHGIGQDHDQWRWEKMHILVQNLVDQGKAKEMILIGCNNRARQDDKANQGTPDEFSQSNTQAFDNFINDFQKDLQPWVEENFSVATGRENTAIVGFSMGGRVSLHLGLTLQETFGFIGAFCPAPGVFDLVPKSDFKLKNGLTTRIMIVGGKSDNVVWNNPEDYHKALEENNVRHSWYKLSGGHDFNTVGHGFYNFAQFLFQ
ncbi:MAG: dienelactone hydrolase family protein [Bacteroidales bacterium]|nr:dienelactone hydrolase family protein [Bacteroidales bacterium]